MKTIEALKIYNWASKYVVELPAHRGEELFLYLASQGIESRVSQPAKAPFDRLEVEEDVNVHALRTVLDQWKKLRRHGTHQRLGLPRHIHRPSSQPPSQAVIGFTVAELARRLRVGEDKIRRWIKAGELVALNTATTLCSKPRFVVTPDALAAFERRPPWPATKGQRRRLDGRRRSTFTRI